MNREALIHDLILLSTNFYKIIEVDLNEDSYFEVKTDESEPKVYNSGLKYWVNAYIDGGGVHPDDIKRFKEFFDPLILKEGTDKWQRCYYRRKINNDWRYVCMEVIPFEHYSHDDAIVLITIRDVEDYIKDFHEQVTLSNYNDYYTINYNLTDEELESLIDSWNAIPNNYTVTTGDESQIITINYNNECDNNGI